MECGALSALKRFGAYTAEKRKDKSGIVMEELLCQIFLFLMDHQGKRELLLP